MWYGEYPLTDAASVPGASVGADEVSRVRAN